MSQRVKTGQAGRRAAATDGGDASAIIERVIRERLAPDFVRSVTVARGEDHDGDPTFEVALVVNRPADEHDRRRLLGLVRHIRTALAEIDVSDFPMIDVVSAADAAKMGLEAA